MTKGNPGKEAKHQFYQAVGNALGQWYSVEMYLFLIFNRLTEGKRNVDSAIFHAIVALNGRIGVVDEVAAIQLRHDPALLARWIELRELVKKAKGERNKIAHYMPKLDLTKPSIDKAWKLQPSMYDITRKAAKSAHGLDTASIEALADEFKQLGKHLSTYLKSLGNWRGP